MKYGLMMAVALAAVLPGFGQESRATIVGRVTDPSGALVAGASVRAVNTATNAAASSTTNEGGNFEIPYLLPGVYNVSVELEGFKKSARNGIELRVSDRMTLDFALELGNVAESVVVTGETPLLETATASGALVVCEIVYAELAAHFPAQSDCDAFLDDVGAGVAPFHRETLFAAAHAWREYRARGGKRERMLADFLVAAHAQRQAGRLLTRDLGFYRSHFPKLKLLEPER